MTHLDLLNEWLQKGGNWHHAHDGWPIHSISVKNHPLYFAKHPELLHPADQPKVDMPTSKPDDKKMDLFDVSNLESGTTISSVFNGQPYSAKLIYSFSDTNGNKKYTFIDQFGKKIYLYPSEITNGKSGYWGLSDIKVTKPGSLEEKEYHEKYAETDFEHLPKGTKVNFLYNSTGVQAVGEVIGQSLSGGTYEILFDSGYTSAVDSHELQTGFFGSGDSKVDVHVVDKPKDLPQVEKLHQLKPGDDVASINQLEPGDIIEHKSHGTKYEVLGIAQAGSMLSVKALDNGEEFIGDNGIAKTGVESGYKFLSSHKDKLTPKKLLPGVALSPADINDLQVGDVLTYGESGNTYTIDSIDHKNDTWTLKNPAGVVFSEDDSGQPSKQISSYVFQHHGEHQEKDHAIPASKLKNLGVGDKIKSKATGVEYTLTSPPNSNGEATTTGASGANILLNLNADNWSVISQVPKHDIHNLPVGTTIDYAAAGYEQDGLTATITGKLLSGQYIIDVVDKHGNQVAKDLAVIQGALKSDTLFGHKILDIQVPDEPKLVQGTPLKLVDKSFIQGDKLVGAKIKSDMGNAGTIIAKDPDHFHVEWSTAPGLAYAYETLDSIGDWTFEGSQSVSSVEPENAAFGGQVQYKEMNIGEPKQIVQIGDETYYKFNVTGEQMWMSESHLIQENASSMTPVTQEQVEAAINQLKIKTFHNLEVDDKLMFNDGSHYKVIGVTSDGLYELQSFDKTGNSIPGGNTTMSPKQLTDEHSSGSYALSIVPKTDEAKLPDFNNLKVGDKFKFNFGSKEITIESVSPNGNINVVHPDGTSDSWSSDSLKSWFHKNAVEYVPSTGTTIDFSKLKVGDSFKDVKQDLTWKITSAGSGTYDAEASDGSKFQGLTSQKIADWTNNDPNNIMSSNAVKKPQKQFKMSMIDTHNLEKGTTFKIGGGDTTWTIVKTWKLKYGGYNYTISNGGVGYGSEQKYSSSDFDWRVKNGTFHSIEVVPKTGYDPKPYIDNKDFELNVGDQFISASAYSDQPNVYEVTEITDGGKASISKINKDGSKEKTWLGSKDVLAYLNNGSWKIPNDAIASSASVPEKTVHTLEVGDKFELNGTVYTIASATKVTNGSGTNYQIAGAGPSPLTYHSSSLEKWKNKYGSSFKLMPMSPSESIKQQPVSTYSPPDITGHVKEMVNWDERLEKVGGKLGYNEGGKFKDKVSGIEFYVKFPQTSEHAEVEQLATNLYRLASVKVAQADLIDFQGKKAILVHWLPNAKDLPPTESAMHGEALRKHFAIDAWLANWDVAGGYDSNNIVESNGEIYRIDPGGALYFRGKGGTKPFGNEVTELQTMKSSSTAPMASKIFAKTTDEELKFGANILMGITDKHIIDAVNDTGLPAAKKNELAATLISRRNDVVQKVLGYQYDPASKGFKHAPVKTPSYHAAPTPKQVEKLVYEMGSAALVKVPDAIKKAGNSKHISLLENAMTRDWSGERAAVKEKIMQFAKDHGFTLDYAYGCSSGWQGGSSEPQARLRGGLNELLGLWDAHENQEQEFFTHDKMKDLMTDKMFSQEYKTGRLHAHELIPFIVASQARLRKLKGNIITFYRGARGSEFRNKVENLYNASDEQSRIAMPNDGASGWSLNPETARARAKNGGVFFKKTVPVEDVLLFFNTWSDGFLSEEEAVLQSLATRFFSKDEVKLM